MIAELAWTLTPFALVALAVWLGRHDDTAADTDDQAGAPW